MISIQQIDYIVTLAEEKHFGKASDRCFITQPTLSMQIKKAEEQLGQVIFDRSRSPLELTAFGEKLLPVLQKIRANYSEISIVKERFEGRYVERLRIAVIPTIASYLVPDMYEKWKERFEYVELELVELKTDEIIEALENHHVDVGIFAGPFVKENMIVRPLFKEEIMAYYPAASSTIVMASELENEHPWLLTSGNCLRTQMVNFCQIQKEQGQGWNYEGGNIDLLMNMVDLEGGYTLVPYYYHSDKHKTRRILSSDGFVPVRDIIAVSPARSIKGESIMGLVRSIQESYPANPKNKQYQVLSWK